MNQDDEPVFKKSKLGTHRYVYNPNHPVGLALIVISVPFAVVMMVLMEQHVGPFAPRAHYGARYGRARSRPHRKRTR
ncbi:hypothetical protein [Streptomyces inhibens]|uniref:hypothetical protein n=1 Tax=Streptomyces inhibens TaxID=2293571 RepID=UPI001EE7370A|nr:hypothetical protein [Streptomyces inhibens]UKY47792.1 hypothetical protein KI385_02365 [Streptomyces inhibens]